MIYKRRPSMRIRSVHPNPKLGGSKRSKARSKSKSRKHHVRRKSVRRSMRR